NVVKLSNELKAYLVREVQPLALNFQLLLCQQAHSFPAIVAAALLSADASLRRLQSSRRAAKILLISNRLARRERDEVFNTNVQTDTRACLCDVSALIQFYAERDIPSVNFSFDSESLDRAFYGTRETHA